MANLMIEKQGNVAVMTWQHEDQNRFTTPFLAEVLTAMAEVRENSAYGALVVTGAQEKFFSTGIFLEWLMAQGAKDPALVAEFMRTLNQLLIETTEFPKPYVAAINGHCVAAGAILAACMDYRVMVEDRGLVRLPEVQINIPFWPGMNDIFLEIMQPQTFKYMAYTGDRFTGKQMHEMGYIDELAPADKVLERSVEIAARLAQGVPDAFAEIKRVLRRRVLKTMREEDPQVIDQFVKRITSGG